MDLLGSILGSMEKPPSISDAEKKKMKETLSMYQQRKINAFLFDHNIPETLQSVLVKRIPPKSVLRTTFTQTLAQKEMIEKQQEKERKKLQDFREKIQTKINNFIKDGTQEKLKFEPMDKTQRAIIHEVADIASLTSFSFGIEEQDRYAIIWKKEFAPSDEELLAYRRDEEWDPEKAKQIAQLRAKEQLESNCKRETKKIQPHSNYKDKYKHLIGDTAAKDAAQSTFTNRSYGFVSSENKRDQRTIEQVLAETRAKKKLKTEHNESQTGSKEECDNTVPQSAEKSEIQSVADSKTECSSSYS